MNEWPCMRVDRVSYHYVAGPAGPASWWYFWAGSVWGFAVGGCTTFYTKDSIVSEVSFSSQFKEPEWLKAVLCNATTSVGNSHRPASPRPTTLEEDRELFVNFSLILCLWFEIQDLRAYNFFDWISNTGNNWFCVCCKLQTKINLPYMV